MSTPVQAGLLALWSFAVHGAFLLGSPLRSTPVSFFFFGDSLHFLAHGHHLAIGQATQAVAFNQGLPFHPPLTAWLTVPLWRLLEQPEAVGLAGKLLMVVLSAATFALLYRLLAGRLPHAFWIVALLPLGFGEMALTGAVNSEIPYRLLLVLTLVLGWRWPFIVGLLQGLAALTRAEHLPFVIAVFGVLMLLPRRWADPVPEAALPRPAARRRFLAFALLGMAVVLVPATLVSHQRLSDYNQRHADELAEPLPTWVPVSFYGPLNFALAQREEGVYFSRRSLPPAPHGDALLDPTFAPHHAYVVHGYRLGWSTIADAPGHFLRRTGKKLAISLSALGYGWTWRDLPTSLFGDGRGRWIRRPVDLARASGSGLAWAVGVFALVGAWKLREHRVLLFIGGLLVLYRLAINAAFFPYLRGMMIVAPFWSALAWLGVTSLGAARLSSRQTRMALVGVLVVLGAFHLTTAPRERSYRLEGERDLRGAIIDDRTVEIEWVGHTPGKQER